MVFTIPLLIFRVLDFSTIMGWLGWAHQKIAETKIYMVAKALKVEVKQHFAAWFISMKYNTNDL